MDRRLHVATFLLGLLFALCAQAGEWHDAADAGDEAKLKSLLSADSKLLNSPDSEGKTALHRAAARGNLDAARFLVASGADVNVKSKSGLTALKLATGFGRTEVAEFLRQKGAIAEPAPVKKPVAATAPPSISTITNTEKLNAFQRRLVKAAEDISRTSDMGFTDLHQAAIDGQVATVQALLARGADVNARDELMGRTALHWAANAGHAAVAQCLLDHKADINALTKGGDTPLTLALAHERGPVIQVLLDRKADVNASCNAWGAALSAATDKEMMPVVVALLQAGANVNRTNVSGWTALHWAAFRNNQPIVETLLATKPRLDIESDSGTPLKVAERHASQEIVDLLRKAAGLPVIELTPTEQKIIAAYKRFENIERRGTMSEIRAATLAMEPTLPEQALIFRANTNIVAKNLAARKTRMQSSWERRTSYSRPRELATRVELVPPNWRIQEWLKKGWINPDLTVCSIRVWVAGQTRRNSYENDDMAYCWINDRLVKLPDEVLGVD